MNNHRESVVAQWKKWSGEFRGEQQKWLKTKVPKKLRKLLRNFHQPLFRRIFESINYEDMAVCERMATGFYFAGMLDEAGVDTVPCGEPRLPAISVKAAN